MVDCDSCFRVVFTVWIQLTQKKSIKVGLDESEAGPSIGSTSAAVTLSFFTTTLADL